MILIDSGYLVALINPRDALHHRALAWARASTEPALVTQFVLLETVNACSRIPLRARCHSILDRLVLTPSYEIVAATPELFDEGLTFHRTRPDKEWSLTDCISFLLMRRRGIQAALSHDHHFEQAGFEALMRRDP